MKENMSLLNQIRKDLNNSRLTQNKQSIMLLSTLLGEAEMIGKNKSRLTTDDECVQIVKKFIKGIDDTLQYSLANSEELEQEKKILCKYLPKQLSKEEICDIINKCSFDNLGSLMKYMKEHFSGQYDGKTVSTLFNGK
jgi:uncharacterized protein YqeY